jgi:hypothetical protein
MDDDARQSLMVMIATCVDAMQDMANYTEEKLGNPLPYNDKQCIAHFSKHFADGIGAKRSRFEDLSIQLKHTSAQRNTKMSAIACALAIPRLLPCVLLSRMLRA